MMEKRWKFEDWIRCTMPEHLGLSDAKKAAMNSVFYHFSDSIKPLEKKAPEEFAIFFSELKELVIKASSKRCPRGYYASKGRYWEKRPRPKIKTVPD